MNDPAIRTLPDIREVMNRSPWRFDNPDFLFAVLSRLNAIKYKSLSRYEHDLVDEMLDELQDPATRGLLQDKARGGKKVIEAEKRPSQEENTNRTAIFCDIDNGVEVDSIDWNDKGLLKRVRNEALKQALIHAGYCRPKAAAILGVSKRVTSLWINEAIDEESRC